MKDATRTVREDIDEATGAITTPIYQTTAYHYPEGEKYRYSREANPTVLELTKKIVELENAEMGCCVFFGDGCYIHICLSIIKAWQ